MTLAGLAQSILDEATTALGTGAPERAFVSHGAPAWEACSADQLTVHLLPLAFQADRGPRGQMTRQMATYHVQIVRCVPGQGNNGEPPSAAALGASAKGLLDDLDAITVALRAAGVFGTCASVQFGQATPLGPSGQVGGYDWQITVGL